MQFIKKYWLLISVIGIILIIRIGGTAGAEMGFEQKLDSILPKDRNNFDFTRTVLSLSALVDPGMDIPWTEKEIDIMAAKLKREIGSEGNPEKIINAFNSYFFDREGFVFDNKFFSAANNSSGITVDDLRNFHSVEKVLKRKQGICLSISLIYLMLGDKLQLPLFGVLLPGHIYVRYKEPGRSGINIETTGSGFEFYGYKDSISLLDHAKTVYGKELDKYSVIGAYLANIGNFFLTTGRNRKARILFNKSIEMLPGSAEGYLNLGLLAETEKKNSQAAEYFEKALALLPGNGYASYRLGAIYLAEKRFVKAEEHLKEAVAKKAGGKDAAKLLEKAKNRDGG